MKNARNSILTHLSARCACSSSPKPWLGIGDSVLHLHPVWSRIYPCVILGRITLHFSLDSNSHDLLNSNTLQNADKVQFFNWFLITILGIQHQPSNIHKTRREFHYGIKRLFIGLFFAWFEPNIQCTFHNFARKDSIHNLIRRMIKYLHVMF